MAMQPKLSSSSSFSSRLWLPRRPRFLLLLLLSVISASLLLLLLLLASPLLLSSPPSFLLRPYLLRPHHALSSFPVLDFLSNPLPLNSTLLAFAQIDLNEPEERRQISHILDGTWPRSSPRRSYDSHRDRFDDRLAVDHYSDRFSVERRRYQRPRARLPIQLTSPRYAPYWPQFRRSLQGWVQNKRHEPQVMNRLLHLVKDRVDKHYMSRMMINNSSVEFGKPYRTCAVVGNSGILLNQSFAELIDSHDMVMRLNNARIMGFERFVGSKTTISFVNSNILHSCTRRNDCFCHPYGVDVPMIMYICQVVHFMDIALCGASHRAPIIVTDPRLDTLCARIVKYYSLKRFIETTGRKPEEWSDAHEGPLFHYSSGMEAVMLAVGMCEKVSIFGFGKSTAAKHHYHTNQKMELRLHDYGAEYQFYMDLATRKSHLIPFLNEAGFTIPSVQIYW